MQPTEPISEEMAARATKKDYKILEQLREVLTLPDLELQGRLREMEERLQAERAEEEKAGGDGKADLERINLQLNRASIAEAVKTRIAFGERDLLVRTDRGDAMFVLDLLKAWDLKKAKRSCKRCYGRGIMGWINKVAVVCSCVPTPPERKKAWIGGEDAIPQR